MAISMQTQPQNFSPVQTCLGESPVWDKHTETLFYIDITAGAIYTTQDQKSPTLVYRSTRQVGALALTMTGNLIFTEDAQVALLCMSTGQVSGRSSTASSVKSFRYNDGTSDPQGRFVTGLMDEMHSVGSGSLHCYDLAMEKSMVLSGMGLPNGIAWSASGSRVYYVDSVAKSIYQAEWCAKSAQLLNPRLFTETPEALGRPDGIALDVEGNLWVCQFNGGCILQYSATGRLLQKIDLPVPRPTSCCFGGKGLSTLYITSARFGMTKEELHRFPQSGDIFQLTVPVAGIEPFLFNDELFQL